uniref:Uncharacterized protein n=1 Tax=Hucho hucho TaxID=62062 RepID=A0A4W5JTU3_9TELE
MEKNVCVKYLCVLENVCSKCLTNVYHCLAVSLTMGQLYEKERDEDGFLYVAKKRNVPFSGPCPEVNL